MLYVTMQTRLGAPLPQPVFADNTTKLRAVTMLQ